MKSLVTTTLALIVLVSGTAHARKGVSTPAPSPAPVAETKRAECYVQTLTANYQIQIGFNDQNGNSAVKVDKFLGSGIQAVTLSTFKAARKVQGNDEIYSADDFELVIHTQSPDFNGIPGDLNTIIEGIEISKYVSCGLYYK